MNNTFEALLAAPVPRGLHGLIRTRTDGKRSKRVMCCPTLGQKGGKNARFMTLEEMVVHISGAGVDCK
jgi:hypothetical protein